MADTTLPKSGGSAKYQLIVKTETGSTVTVTKNNTVKPAKERNGVWSFKGLSAGDWIITCTKNDMVAMSTVTIVEGAECLIEDISYRVIPVFTYTGTYEVVDDNNNTILNLDTYSGNWKIRFLTSGTLTFQKLNGAKNGIDVFLLGGGGGGSAGGRPGGADCSGAGGGSGYTSTVNAVPVVVGVAYEITIGAGGIASTSNQVNGADGGDTSAFGHSATGGMGGTRSYFSPISGGNGGSGGGAGGTKSGAKGGTDGSDGDSAAFVSTTHPGGNGQGTTTREFGEDSGKLYAKGGDSGQSEDADTEQNTGNGGNGGNVGNGNPGFDGKSGIIVIRNAREVAA